MLLSLRASLPLVAVFALGCTAPTVDDVADASLAMTDGVVLVERSVSADGTTQSSVSAKFMRLAAPADPDLAERVVGSRLELPAAGACKRTTAEGVGAAARSLGSLGAIELIDVGDVTLRAGHDAADATAMRLAARAFPDVGDLVSGMFYTSRDTAVDLPAGTLYTLEGTGSAQVDRFAIEAEAPAAPEDVRVGGVALGEGPALSASTAATLRWRAAPPSDTGREDLVIVDVGAETGASIRCAFRDAGRGVVPGWVWSASSLGALPTTATVAVHRVRERAFTIGGLDAGAVRFDLSVVGRVVVQPQAR